jgi:hypothetical protein
VGGVPQILIRGGSSEILEYGGPRMAESVSKEALSFLSGGSKLHGGRIFGGDMLLGGQTTEAVGLEGGRRRSRSRRSRRMRGGSSSPSLEGGRRRRRRRLSGGSSPSLEGGRRRRRRRSLRGGAASPTPEPVVETDLSGGRKKVSKWVAHVTSYMRKHRVSLKKAMKAARASYYK